MYDPELSRLITAAVARLQAELAGAAPFMAQQVCGWLEQLAGGAQPEAYFKHPIAFPALLLPWWLEKRCDGSPELAFQADLTYSTLNGYYYIRLIDNLLDGQATVELKLLPALGFFHTQFQSAYRPYFAAYHPFWDFFAAVWFHSAEVTMRDAGLTGLDESQFEQIAAQKICAAKIPLAAVCYRRRRPDLIEPWSRFVDRLGCWHQLFNDLFDWPGDQRRQIQTYFLSEAERRRHTDEPVAAWVIREGFNWAAEKLEQWMVALQAMAADLGSPELVAYLKSRQAMLRQQNEGVAEGLRDLAKIVALAGEQRSG